MSLPEVEFLDSSDRMNYFVKISLPPRWNDTGECYFTEQEAERLYEKLDKECET